MKSKTPKVVGPHDGPGILTISRLARHHPVERMTLVDVKYPDGQKGVLYKSDSRPGLFRQAFVPWDFEHPLIEW